MLKLLFFRDSRSTDVRLEAGCVLTVDSRGSGIYRRRKPEGRLGLWSSHSELLYVLMGRIDIEEPPFGSSYGFPIDSR